MLDSEALVAARGSTQTAATVFIYFLSLSVISCSHLQSNPCCTCCYLEASPLLHTETFDAATLPPANQPASEDSLLRNLSDGGTCWSAPGAACCITSVAVGGVKQNKISGEEQEKFLDASSSGKLQVKVQSQSFLPWKKFRLLYRFQKKNNLFHFLDLLFQSQNPRTTATTGP